MKAYFDHAATSYIYDEVIDYMTEIMKENYGNPSSTHSFGQQAKAIIENARKSIANAVGAEPQEIVFTSSGTEANNLIIRSAVEKLKVQRLVTTLMEHKCVLETTMAMRKLHNLDLQFLPIDRKGNFQMEDIEKVTSDDTPTLVSLMHANNEVGNLYPIDEVAQNLKSQEHVLLHTDTIQSIGHIQLNFKDLAVDYASASAHKFHGPKGVGFAFIRKDSKLAPIIFGGGQERNMRSGTENVYGIAGMAKALEISQKEQEKDEKYLKELKSYTIQKLKEAIPFIQFNGTSEDIHQSLYTVLNIFVPSSDPMLGFKLDMKGVAISQGSACSSGAAKVSMVMSRLRTDEELKAFSPIRLSFSPRNTKEEIDYFVQNLKEIVGNTKVNA